MSGYVMDTSVFVAAEQQRSLGGSPAGPGRVSVATMTELRLGVLRSAGGDLTVRQTTLARAARFITLPYDEAVAERLAEGAERRRRAGLMDAIIAATALVHDLAVWTQDDDFDVLGELAPALRVHRG